MTRPFWESKPLEALSAQEWESLCDGCGRCCLHKLQDPRSGQVCYTNIACRLLDIETCRCTAYAERHRHVRDCLPLTPATLADASWLPDSCAYRRVAQGRALPSWHPLLTGDAGSVHEAGMSVRGLAVPEAEAGSPLHHLLDWPVG